MKRVSTSIAAIVGALAVMAPALARADEGITEYVPTDNVAAANGDPDDGWNGKLTLSVNLNLASNSHVVGQVDGFSLLIGTGLDGLLQYDRDAHRWQNKLSINEIWARTPVLDEFVKSNDVLALESLYNYFLWSWGGLFARLSAETSLFPAERITADPETYALEGDDPVTQGESTERFDLSDSFQPFTLTESVGVFAEPTNEEAFRSSLRAGFGGRHTFADGVRVIADDGASFDDDGDPATADVSLVTYKVLQDVHQAGLELFAGFEGKGAEGRLHYNLGASLLFPFINNDDMDRGAIDLMRIGLEGGLGTSVFTWMTLEYKLKIIDDPQLLDETQIQNSLLLTIALTPVDTFEPPKDEAAEKLEAAEERAEEAEKRAVEAEKRAAEAEKRAAEAEAARASEAAPAPEAPAAPAEAAPAEAAPAEAPPAGAAPAAEPAPPPAPQP